MNSALVLTAVKARFAGSTEDFRNFAPSFGSAKKIRSCNRKRFAMTENTHSARSFATNPDPLNSVLAANWWVVAIRGVLGIIFGLVAP
jgi:hypothetical protein